MSQKRICWSEVTNVDPPAFIGALPASDVVIRVRAGEECVEVGLPPDAADLGFTEIVEHWRARSLDRRQG